MLFYVREEWDEIFINDRKETEEFFDDYIDTLYPEPVVILGINFYPATILHSNEIAYRQEFDRWLSFNDYKTIAVPWELTLIPGGVGDYIADHREDLEDC